MKCRVCDSTNLERVIDLGQQPWRNDFIRKEDLGQEPYYPLWVVYCHDCPRAQLDYTVPKETMFENQTYRAGVTGSLSDHFQPIALEVDQQFIYNTLGESVLDIGSNDGTQLNHLKALGYNVLAIEAAKTTARIANAADIETGNEFFNLALSRRLVRNFHLINAAGVFFHLEELQSVTDGHL